MSAHALPDGLEQYRDLHGYPFGYLYAESRIWVRPTNRSLNPHDDVRRRDWWHNGNVTRLVSWSVHTSRFVRYERKYGQHLIPGPLDRAQDYPAVAA